MSKSKSLTNGVSDSTLKENIEHNIKLIAVQYVHAQEVPPSARSGYYKVAILLASSVAEALVYELVKRHSFINSLPVAESVIFKSRQQLSQKFKCEGSSNRLAICEKQEEIKNADEVTFMELNRYCKRHKVVSQAEFSKMEYVRKTRNRIHIQSLEKKDVGYTKKLLEKVSSVIDFISLKLEELPD